MYINPLFFLGFFFLLLFWFLEMRGCGKIQSFVLGGRGKRGKGSYLFLFLFYWVIFRCFAVSVNVFEVYRALCLWVLLDLQEETMKRRSFLYLCLSFLQLVWCASSFLLSLSLSLEIQCFCVLVFWEREREGVRSSIHEALLDDLMMQIINHLPPLPFSFSCIWFCSSFLSRREEWFDSIFMSIFFFS